MTPFTFYFWFAILVESFPAIPLFLGVRKWRKFPVGIRVFLGLFAADLIINLIGDYYYYQHRNNLFLNYFYSFFQSFFILLAYWYFYENKAQKSIVALLLILSIALLAVDVLFVSKVGFNYMSASWINFIILSTSIYYFLTNLVSTSTKQREFNGLKLMLTLIVSFQFFVKTIAVFLEKYLLETQNNSFLWFQVREIYYFFMLFSLLLYTYAFYVFQTNKK